MSTIQCGWIKDEHMARSLPIALRVMAGAIFASGEYVSQFGLPRMVYFVIRFDWHFLINCRVCSRGRTAATLGFVAGYCAARHFGRLTLHRADVCLAGLVDEVHQDDRFYISWL
jgi:hypothetical protein